MGNTEGKRLTLEVLGQRGQIVRISNPRQRDDELFRRLTSINRREIDGAGSESVRSRGIKVTDG